MRFPSYCVAPNAGSPVQTPPGPSPTPTAFANFDFNDYTENSETLVSSISGGGTATIAQATNNTFNTSTPTNHYLQIYAPDNYPGLTGGVVLPSITGINTIEVWVNYPVAEGYSQYFLDGRTGAANLYWITPGDTIGSDLVGGQIYFNTLPTTITATTPNVASTLDAHGWNQVVIVTPAAFTDDVSLFMRFSEQQGMPINIADISVYTAPLTAGQITEIYNTKCTRYGLSPV